MFMATWIVPVCCEIEKSQTCISEENTIETGSDRGAQKQDATDRKHGREELGVSEPW